MWFCLKCKDQESALDFMESLSVHCIKIEEDAGGKK